MWTVAANELTHCSSRLAYFEGRGGRHSGAESALTKWQSSATFCGKSDEQEDFSSLCWQTIIFLPCDFYLLLLLFLA